MLSGFLAQANRNLCGVPQYLKKQLELKPNQAETLFTHSPLGIIFQKKQFLQVLEMQIRLFLSPPVIFALVDSQDNM